MTDRGRAPPHPYLAGLVLAGRKVVVVGGGHVAQRRVPALLGAGAAVTVVSPEVTPALEGMAHELTLVLREFTETDLDGAWYVVAATDDAGGQRARGRGRRGAPHLLRPQPTTRSAAPRGRPAVGHHGTRDRRRAGQPRAAEVGGAARRHRHRAARRPPDGVATPSTARPASCSSAADRASPSSSPSPPATPSPPPTSWSPTGWRRASCSTSSVPHVELIDVAKLPARPLGLPGRHQRGDRRPRARRQAGGALQGRRQLRLRPRLRGAAGVRGRRRARHRRPRPDAPPSPSRPGSASR